MSIFLAFSLSCFLSFSLSVFLVFFLSLFCCVLSFPSLSLSSFLYLSLAFLFRWRLTLLTSNDECFCFVLSILLSPIFLLFGVSFFLPCFRSLFLSFECSLFHSVSRFFLLVFTLSLFHYPGSGLGKCPTNRGPNLAPAKGGGRVRPNMARALVWRRVSVKCTDILSELDIIDAER